MATTAFVIRESDFEPAHAALYRTGDLRRRADEALRALRACALCPRNCRVDRLSDKVGVCKIGRFARVASCFPHFGEEDCLRGWNGSGTIFFSMCNLRCVFCQNYDISHERAGAPVAPERLAALMLELQAYGCHNINFVTPEHVVPQLLESLVIAVEKGLRLPIVYNTSAYDSLESLRLLDGVVDIYMPDFKFWDAESSRRFLIARNYPESARRAILEMHRQVGPLRFNERGLARRGVLVRHLVMPGLLDETEAILQFLANEVSPNTYVNVMAQYHPAGKVSATQYPELNRRPTTAEYRRAVEIAEGLGLRLDERRNRWVL